MRYDSKQLKNVITFSRKHLRQSWNHVIIKSVTINNNNWKLFWLAMLLTTSTSKGHHHHHHHWQPWAQCPLVSDAIVTIAAHRCLSTAAWLNSCRVAPHHCSMSSDHSRWGCPLLFEPSIIPNTRVFIFLLSSILQIWPKRRSFLCITFCSRVSANWIFLYNSSLVTYCVDIINHQ